MRISTKQSREVVMRVMTGAAKMLEPVAGEAATIEAENGIEMKMPATAGELDVLTVAIEGLLTKSLLEEWGGRTQASVL